MVLTRKYIVMFVLMALLYSNCSKDDQEYYEARIEASFEINPGLNTLETHYFLIRDVPSFFLQNLNVRNWNVDNIDKIESSRGILTSTFGGLDFDFVERISIYAISQKDRTVKKEMFYREQVPFNQGNDIKLLTSTSNISSIIQEEFFDIEVRLKFKQFPPIGVNCLLDIGYVVFRKK